MASNSPHAHGSLIDFASGGYEFLKGGFPYSCGVAAKPGFAIVHARLHQLRPLAAGFARVKQHLETLGRPLTALCGMELRSPEPFTFDGFKQFNKGYVAVLESWGIVRDGLNPVARTNVAPEVNPPAEPSLYAFSYTVPSAELNRDFVVSGGGELPEGALNPQEVIRLGDVTPDGIRAKAEFVMGLMEGRILGLGRTWADATVTQMPEMRGSIGWKRSTKGKRSRQVGPA